MADYYVVPKSALTATADAIKEKTGSEEEIEFTQNGFADAVEAIETDVDNSHDLDDVIFIDYDGTVLYYYTATEFSALTEMPLNPSHDGLISQGWNWSLADAQEYVEEYGRLTIGQSYITDDGKTRFYYDIPADDLSVSIQWQQSADNVVSIDWGDGNTTEPVAGKNTNIVSEHTYGAPGLYCISFNVSNGYLNFATSIAPNDSVKKRMRLKKIEFGVSTRLTGTGPFTYYLRLETVTFPTGYMENMQRSGFEGCTSLRAAVIPSGVTTTGVVYCAFSKCHGLKFISLPKSVTSMSANRMSISELVRFESPPDCVHQPPLYGPKLRRYTINAGVTTLSHQECFALESIVIPSGITTIPINFSSGCNGILYPITVPATVDTISGTNSFNGCSADFHFLSTTPPTLQGTNAFLKNPATRIFVPYSSDHSVLEAYQTTTNWSVYADYMLEEPQ